MRDRSSAIWDCVGQVDQGIGECVAIPLDDIGTQKWEHIVGVGIVYPSLVFVIMNNELQVQCSHTTPRRRHALGSFCVICVRSVHLRNNNLREISQFIEQQCLYKDIDNDGAANRTSTSKFTIRM